MASYDFWHRALAGEEVGGSTLPIHDGEAHPGYYRKRQSRAGAFLPVAIWEHEGALVALVDGKQADPADVWSYCCRYPVTNEAYDTRVSTGKWPDEDGAVAESLTPPPASQAIGANNPPDDAALIKSQIESASANIADYAEIKDDETAKKAQGVRSRLLELSGEADKKREAEKKPHLEAGRVVDERYQPVVKLGKALADQIKASIGAHETRKLNAQREAARLAEEARVKAERERAKAEAKGRPAPPPAPAPEPPPPVQTAIKSSYGRAASTAIVRIAKVTDMDALWPFLKDRPEVIELFATLAQRAVKAGHTPPGVSIEEEVAIR